MPHSKHHVPARDLAGHLAYLNSVAQDVDPAAPFYAPGLSKLRAEAETTARVRVGRITMHRTVAIDMMALEIATRGLEGCVREVDLVKLGFTSRQIADWAPDAYRKAVAENPKLAAMLNEHLAA
jgi:hypothetical protein